MYCERCDKLGFDKCHCEPPIWWELHSGGRSVMDPPAIVTISESRKPKRRYRYVSDHSLQRLINISESHGVELQDESLVVVWGKVTR